MAISLANKRFIEEACEKEKCASFVRTFFVSGKYSGEWIKCSSTTCAIDQPPADFNKTSSVLNVDESFASAGKDPYVFCFACDRIFHVKCQELDLCSLLSSAAPYLCIDCTTNPLNEFAVGFYNSKKWICGVAARRRRMFDAETINKCPELMGEQTLCLDFEAEDILSFVNTEGVSEESLGLILALERQKLETQKAALKFVHHLETSKETMQEQEDTIEILKRELAAEKAKNTKPSAAEQTNPPRKRVSFFPESFDAESTRTAKPRNVQIKTIDSVLENLLNKSRLNHSNDSSRSAKYDSKRPYNTAVLESSLPSLNDPELTMTERMMLCATRAHLESSYVQNQVSQEMKLGVIRKNLQKITKFKGDARGWLKFKQEVNRYRELGQYEDDVMKIIVFGALEGDAEKRVKDLIDVATLEQIMEILETSFGHAPSIIKACESDILKFRLKGELMRNDAVHINTMIQTYLNSCSTAGVPTLNSNMLATHILSQLNSTHKLFFRQHYHHKRPQDTTQMPDLEIMFSFLEGLAYDLEVRVEEKEDKPQRPKPIQVNSTATNTSFSSSAANSSGNSSEQDFMFKVLDGKIAKYVGYDMSLVGMLNKKCFACSFRPYRRSNTNRNSRRGQQLATNQVPNKSTQDLASSSANNSDQTPKLTGAISLANDPKNAVLYATFPRQLQTMSYNNHRTVKMFKHIVYGPTEGTYVYSIGDSAAEISLMREDLRQQLGIEGTRTTIDLQWKDDTIQTIPAIKIKLEIQSLNSEELIVLNDVYAVEEAYFSLPTRSLDVTQLKQQFPYLKEAEFDSYENAKPVLLIGTPHASCFEAIEPMLQDGEGKPVAIKTKLGWTIFGGSPEMYAKEPYAIEMTVQSPESQKVDDAESKSNDRQLNELFAHFCSIESLGITPKSSHMTDEEKAAIRIIEQEWRVVENGAIEVH
ncbi:hypothetical protein PVAND_011939 [Polypedilum vanderplanki]|uniref:Uncharacterized protein n=1 Tax=Polypedilum vanderplanki TaxID=319348 RepID=A0A9J6CK36_POLVA|nr:hypothetical protein PVAND_011939 [Polypedilum vanderplanki]